MKRLVKLDLIGGRIIRRGILSPLFPMSFQVLALLGMAALTVNGWGIGTDLPEKGVMTLRKTNLTTLAIWGLWWPGMIALALFAGRLWCTLCPMELASRIGRAVGQRLGLTRLPMGKVLRAGWLILAAYVVLQFLVSGLSIHRVPHYTSLFLLALGGLAVATGLFFREERAFCKSFCPAAALLSVYGRFTRIQLDKIDADTCTTCKSKDCVRASNRDRFDARSCPSLIRPYERNPSDGCVLCFQCAKVCPKENIGFGIVASEAGSRRQQLLKPFEAGFALIAAGFVTHEIIGEVKWLDGLFHRVPLALQRGLPGIGFGWFEAIWFLALFPLAFWALVVIGARLTGQRGPLGDHLRAVATGAAPVIALAHLAKALAKVGNWGGFAPLAMRDPVGLNTLAALAKGQMTAPAALWGLSALGLLILGAMAILGWRSFNWLRQHPEKAHLPGLRVGFVGATAFFSAVLLIWARG